MNQDWTKRPELRKSNGGVAILEVDVAGRVSVAIGTSEPNDPATWELAQEKACEEAAQDPALADEPALTPKHALGLTSRPQ